MNKRTNKYKLTLEPLELAKGDAAKEELLSLEFENHDEIFGIIERVKQKKLFGDDNQSAEFAIGLKMFGEVMLKNRNHPIFEELAPAFKEFMKKLKQS